MSEVERLLDRCLKVQAGLTKGKAELTKASAIVTAANDHDASTVSGPSTEVAARRGRTPTFLDVQRELHGALSALGSTQRTISTVGAVLLEVPEHATLDQVVDILQTTRTTTAGLVGDVGGVLRHLHQIMKSGALFRLQDTKTGRSVQRRVLDAKPVLDEAGKEVANLHDHVVSHTDEAATPESGAREQRRRAADEAHRAMATWDDVVAAGQSILATLHFATTAIGIAFERTSLQRERAGRFGYRKVAEGWDETSAKIVGANADVELASQSVQTMLDALDNARGLPSIDDLAAVLRSAGVADLAPGLTSAREATVRAGASIPLRERARLSSVIDFKLHQATTATLSAESGYAKFLAGNMPLLVRLQAL